LFFSFIAFIISCWNFSNIYYHSHKHFIKLYP
jgi:hypothetical protein